MSEPLPTLGQMYARLVAEALAVGAGVCVLIVPFGWLSTPASSGQVTDFSVLAALLFGLMAVSVAVAVGAIVRRTGPLYRALVRAHESGEADVPPPSAAALRDAFGAPRWMGRVTGVFLLAAIVLHATGALLFSGLFHGRRLLFDLVTGAMLAFGILPAALLWKRSLWSWLRRVAPSDVPSPSEHTVVRKLAVAVVLPLLGVTLAAVALLLGHLEDAPLDRGPGFPLPLLALGAWGAAILTAAAVARGTGRILSRDLRVLAERVGATLAPVPGEGASERETAADLRTPQVAQLARRVGTLAERHAQSVEEEGRARYAIEQVQQLKGRFMAYMSHDLRSPLNSIKGFAEILARGTDGSLNSAQHESVDMIRESGDALLRLVNDILDSAKLESGRLDLHREWTPSVEILTEAVRQARGSTGDRNTEIVTELEPGLPPVYVDRERIVQAVGGILGHVLQSMREGSVRLRARVQPDGDAAGRHLRVEVIDVSAGLRPEERERLFETLRAIREPSGRRMGGLGLGLSLARGLVTAHGGDVWYESYDESGTAFCVSLPLTVATGA